MTPKEHKDRDAHLSTSLRKSLNCISRIRFMDSISPQLERNARKWESYINFSKDFPLKPGTKTGWRSKWWEAKAPSWRPALRANMMGKAVRPKDWWFCITEEISEMMKYMGEHLHGGIEIERGNCTFTNKVGFEHHIILLMRLFSIVE